MKRQKTLPDKVFKVDKKIVIKNLLPFQIFMVVAILLFLNNITQIITTITSSEFWLWMLGIFGGGFLLNLWSILYERTEFRGNTITNYFNVSTSANILDFVSVKQTKTPYTNYLGFDYREPKGVYVRYLLPYGLYNPKDLQAIMQEILKINPNIKLEDNLSRQILAGTYKTKILGQ